jgi:hypothetical protein
MDAPNPVPPDQQVPQQPTVKSVLLLPAPHIQAIKAHIQNHPYRRLILGVGGVLAVLILVALIKFAVNPSLFSEPKVT